MGRFFKTLLIKTDGATIVEATILFPTFVMIFAALVLLSIYLPQRAILQRATQYTATAISTARSDEWIDYDGYGLYEPAKAGNVYETLFKAFGKKDEAGIAETSVRRLEKQYTMLRQLDDYDHSEQFSNTGLTITYDVLNLILYKEVIVTAQRRIPLPVDLSFLGLPETLNITVTSVAAVQNGEEFVRDVDIVVDFVRWLDDKYGISDNFESIIEGIRIVEELLNI